MVRLSATELAQFEADAESMRGVHRDTAMAAPASSRAELAIAGASARPVDRARAMVKRMNATEKYQLLSGVWGLGWAPPEEQVSEKRGRDCAVAQATTHRW